MVNVIELGDLRVFLLDERAIGGTRLIDRHISYHAEHRLQLRQTLFGSFGAREFLMIECDGAVWVLDRDQRFIKTALGDRLRGARLTHQRQIINRIAINALQCRNRVRADTLL